MKHGVHAWAWVPVIFFLGCFVLPASASEVRADAGILRIGGILRADSLDIGAGAQLQGNGIIEGNVRVEGILSPGGAEVALLTIRGALVFVRSGRFYVT